MAANDLICMVSLGENVIFVKLSSTTSFYELQFDVSERLKVPKEALSFIFKSERHPNLSFSVDNDDDLKCMLDHNRNIGYTEIHMQAAVNVECSTSRKNQIREISDASLNAEYSRPPPRNASNSERIQNDFPSGEVVMRADDILNNTSLIPQWWHTSLTEKGYEQMVKETNPGSYICIDQNEGRFKRLFICYAACIENVDNWRWFLQGLWSILYERLDPYNPPHQLVIISDADKGIREAVREYFPEAIHSRCVLHLVENFRTKLKDLGLKAKDTQVLGSLLQSACYKYTIAEWNDYMKEIYEMAPVAYEIVLCYSPENWANAFFPGIRYGHVTSNVAESFNSWIREARLLRILQMVEHIRKQIMSRLNNRRIMADKWTSYLCPKTEQIVRENMERGRTLEIKQSRDDIFEV
ncbi:uncharacterized protein LOC109846946 [Asparagus officinalis]|uniref:uncharacterized protein LOC109846946 n=1 Tax=Asparagus officinalis TaxID=4686 RepID=UPI00098E2A91|nr:uncharacterized protein LOC109846946 [Asparagus officinalis]